MSEQRRMIINHFLKPIAQKVGQDTSNEKYFDMMVEGIPYRPAPEMEYRAQKLLENWDKMKMPSKKQLREAMEWVAFEDVPKREEEFPDWERGSDGKRYRNGQMLLCDMDQAERLEVIKRVHAKYPVGAEVITKVIGGRYE